jgi:hypothetical protein
MSIFQLNDREPNNDNDFVAADKERNKTIEAVAGSFGVALLVWFILSATSLRPAAASIAAAAGIFVFFLVRKRL